MTKVFAPILAFTCDEIWLQMPHRNGDDGRSVLLNQMSKPYADYALSDAEMAVWETALRVRSDVNGVLETARADKRIGKSLEAHVALIAGDEDAKAALDAVKSVDLPEIFIVSNVSTNETAPAEGAVVGQGVNFPGLTVDLFQDILVTEVLSLGMEVRKHILYPLLVELLKDYGVTVRAIYERNEAALRDKEGLPKEKGFYPLPGLATDLDGHLELVENGIRYDVDYINGQKTGFFLDQKYNRRAVARLAAGHTVLDCFTHTGSFALNAAKGGAARVTAADISADAIAMAKRNAERNGLTNMDFLCEDTFELLPRLEREGHPYDFIILDPPAFTKARRTVENAMRGYKEINYRAMKLLPRGGYLATASCSHFATEELFIKMLRAAAKDAHRQLRQIEVKQQAPDHPILWGVPETNYLKFFLFQVI